MWWSRGLLTSESKVKAEFKTFTTNILDVLQTIDQPDYYFFAFYLLIRHSFLMSNMHNQNKGKPSKLWWSRGLLITVIKQCYFCTATPPESIAKVKQFMDDSF